MSWTSLKTVFILQASDQTKTNQDVGNRHETINFTSKLIYMNTFRISIANPTELSDVVPGLKCKIKVVFLCPTIDVK